jgi:hypothetical protein
MIEAGGFMVRIGDTRDTAKKKDFIDIEFRGLPIGKSRDWKRDVLMLKNEHFRTKFNDIKTQSDRSMDAEMGKGDFNKHFDANAQSILEGVYDDDGFVFEAIGKHTKLPVGFEDIATSGQVATILEKLWTLENPLPLVLTAMSK